MKTFATQLEAVRANVSRLEALVLACPDLFEHGYGIGVDADRVWVYLHARQAPPEFDWRGFARRYRAAGWKREDSASGPGFDWRGKLNGVEIAILGAEQRSEPEDVFEAEPQPQQPAPIELPQEATA